LNESDLAALGIHRIPIPVPFPQAGGPVNVYLLEEASGGVVMFDAGLGTPEAEAALSEGFSRAGHRFEEVTRIVLSHGHVDHYGAALSVLERAGRAVPVQAHPADIPKVASTGWRWEELLPAYAAHLRTLGVPEEMLEVIGREVGRGLALARRIPEVSPIAPGEVLRVGRLELEVLHMPGHTPGLICLHERRHRLFFSADHLLERVSPNPILELPPDGEAGPYRPLVSYLDSVSRLRSLDVDLVLPGHGPPFGDHRRVIDGLLDFHERRQARIREALASGSLTAFEVTRALFPSAGPRDLFLVVSEAIANLEVMEVRGEVVRALRGDVYRFTASR
jgi:glyoxylase-like metal-dependent hydrolase (beta-lactamase superfamily II)